jgi:ABC-type bacteriocin/lantibiotic exporter with double-glycine peptidase domain
MNVVVQEESSGCGLACVAMIAGRTYSEVKQLANRIGIFAEDIKLYSDTSYVRRLLDEYDIQCSKDEKPFTSWQALPERALLAIKYRIENGHPLWHWVVFVREESDSVVLAPASYLERNKRLDFDRIAPKWFIEVH